MSFTNDMYARAVQRADRSARLAENRLIEWKRAERACDRMQRERDDLDAALRRVMALLPPGHATTGPDVAFDVHKGGSARAAAEAAFDTGCRSGAFELAVRIRKAIAEEVGASKEGTL